MLADIDLCSQIKIKLSPRHYITLHKNTFEFLVRVTSRILIPPDFLILVYSTAVTLLLKGSGASKLCCARLRELARFIVITLAVFQYYSFLRPGLV
jgi:hypothetical protein